MHNEKTQELAKKIEALLFVEAGELKIETLARMLETSKEEIQKGLDILQDNYTQKEGGIMLVRTHNAAALATAPVASAVVQEIAEKTLDRNIGPAGLEVLAILLYKGDTSRAGIDYIRGVNSASTLRNLFLRNLIERIKNQNDAREFLYKPTTELLAHLGVTRAEELPEYEERRSALMKFEAQEENKEEEEGE